MYSAYITRIKNVRKHTNADRLRCGECFGNTVIVGLDTPPDELGVYFPVDGKLGLEFATKHDLIRRKDEIGNDVGGYLDPVKRNIKAIRLRGEQSDGLFMPLESLSDFTDISALKEGDTITVLNGITICEKYTPAYQLKVNFSNSSSKKKKKHLVAPLFLEHVDTAQLAYNLHAFHTGDQVEISLKMHGTSQRTAYVPRLFGYHRTFWDKLFRRFGEPVYDYDGVVTGTRRVVLDSYDDISGFYGSNSFRERHSNHFDGKLHKGETVYYEVVGFIDSGAPIMSSCSNKKIGDKEFTKKYGETTVFSYGCNPTSNKSDMYVYRMTMTNEDGVVVEYPPHLMRYRCEQMGVKYVPLLWSGTIPEEMEGCEGEWIKNIAEEFYAGTDPIGKTHIREGVVVRIVNRPKFTAYKHKNFEFKMLEGLIKDSALAPDMEESQEQEAA